MNTTHNPEPLHGLGSPQTAKESVVRRGPIVSLSLAILAGAAYLGCQGTASADPLPYGPDSCIQGFVWRDANPTDHVCVTPDVRTRTGQENQLASQRVSPSGGPYGPDTCLEGFVWREALTGDHVCVPPESRTEAANDNAAAPSRKATNV